MDENELLSKLILVVTIGAAVAGGIYVYRKNNKKGNVKPENDSKFSVSLGKITKEKIITYFDNLKDEERRHYKNNYLDLYFDLKISDGEDSSSRSDRVSGPYDLGLNFEEAQLAYSFIKDTLLGKLNLKSDISNSDVFILAHDYYTYLGKKEAFDEVINTFNLKTKSEVKYNKVSEQLEKELESLKK